MIIWLTVMCLYDYVFCIQKRVSIILEMEWSNMSSVVK